MVVPITSSERKRQKSLPTHLDLQDLLPKKSVAMFEQVLTVNREQLSSKIGNVPDSMISRINQKLEIAFGLCPQFSWIKETTKNDGSIKNRHFFLLQELTCTSFADRCVISTFLQKKGTQKRCFYIHHLSVLEYLYKLPRSRLYFCVIKFFLCGLWNN